jgi:hypothetical protein
MSGSDIGSAAMLSLMGVDRAYNTNQHLPLADLFTQILDTEEVASKFVHVCVSECVSV